MANSTQLGVTHMPIRIIRGMPPPDLRRNKYPFADLKNGDALEVDNVVAAMEMFRRWRHRTGRDCRLTKSPDHDNVLFFFEPASKTGTPIEEHAAHEEEV